MHDRVALVRRRLDAAGMPHLANPSHIVPVMVGDPVQCKRISDILLERYGIYVQPINYPTVPRGTERLRLTPSPLHTDADIEHLVASLAAIWAAAQPADAPPDLRHAPPGAPVRPRGGGTGATGHQARRPCGRGARCRGRAPASPRRGR